MEEITTVATDPFRTLEEFNANTYDQMLPQHAGADQGYIGREGTWLEVFASRFRDRRINAMTLILDRHVNLVPMQDFRYYQQRVRDGVVGDGTSLYLDASFVRLLAVIGNRDIFRLKYHDVNWPAQLPQSRSQYNCRSISKAVFAQLRHNQPVDRMHYPRRDSGGWVPLDVLAEFFTHHKQNEMAPIEEYIKDHSHLFRSEKDARIAAFVAHLAGCIEVELVS